MSEVVQGKPEDLVGANPGIAVKFQQKGLLEAQHLVFISLTHMNTQPRTHYSSEMIPLHWKYTLPCVICRSFYSFLKTVNVVIQIRQPKKQSMKSCACQLSRRQRDTRPLKYLPLVVLLPYSICSCQEWAGDLVLLCCGLFLWRADSEETKIRSERLLVPESWYLCNIAIFTICIKRQHAGRHQCRINATA